MITFIMIQPTTQAEFRLVKRALPVWFPTFGQPVSRYHLPLDRDSLVLGHPYLAPVNTPEGDFISIAISMIDSSGGKYLRQCDLRFKYENNVMTPLGVTEILGLKETNDFSNVVKLVKFIQENKHGVAK